MNEKTELRKGFPVLKKLASLLLAFILVFTVSVSAIGETAAGEEQPAAQAAETKEPERSFAIPVGVGIVYSVIIYRNGISVVFSPIMSKAASLGMKIVDYLTDVQEIKLYYKNGQTAVLPATVEIKTYDVGIFVSLNLTLDAVKAIFDLFSVKSSLDRVAFVHSDKSEQDLSVDELNQVLSDAFGSAVDVVGRAGQAIGVFLKNLANGVWTFAADAYDSVATALAGAWQWFSDSASSVGQSIGEAVGNAWQSTGDFMQNAADTVTDLWNGLWGQPAPAGE